MLLLKKWVKKGGNQLWKDKTLAITWRGILREENIWKITVQQDSNLSGNCQIQKIFLSFHDLNRAGRPKVISQKQDHDEEDGDALAHVF